MILLRAKGQRGKGAEGQRGRVYKASVRVWDKGVVVDEF